MASSTTLVWVCLAAILCGALVEGSHREKRVVGGTQYPDGKYPFSLSLWYMGDNNPYTANTPELGHTCGATLLNENWALTAAVCFDDTFIPGLTNLSLWVVAAGMYAQTDASTQAQLTTIDYFVISPEYNLTESYGDVALLRLSDSIDLTDPRVGTVDINKKPFCPEVDQVCTVIGWGQEEEFPYGNGSNYPHEVDVAIVSLDDCADVYENNETQQYVGPVRIDNRIVCAGVQGGGKDACYGDSGSPLLCTCPGSTDPVEVGIVSYGFGCARDGYPGVYSRVSAYASWIVATIASDP